MENGFRFRDWKVYKDAREFRASIKKLLVKYPKHELFSLIDQTKRALNSILLNLAEGSNKNTDKDNDTTLKSNAEARNTKIALQLIFPLEDKFMLGAHIAYGKIYSFFNPAAVNIAGIKDNTPIQYISFGFSVLYQL